MDSPDPTTDAIRLARAMFPRGLAQPEAGWRFSLDALLLGFFAGRPQPGSRVLDLCCGCGPAGFALLLRDAEAEMTLTGLDLDPDMIRAARENAARLGVSERHAAHVLDVREVRARAGRTKNTAAGATDAPQGGDGFRPAPESFGQVLCNPPYRAVGSGRACPGEGRNRARFETHGTLKDFVDAASFFLANKGLAAFVYPAVRLAALFACLTARRLEPKRLLPVHSHRERPARLVLVEAIKNGGPGLVLEPPLVLYGEGKDAGSPRPRMTAQALAFCPFLAANA
ncbi:tRNA1(Val) (adenine(37)-N6)-methyltransferase [Desulfolutivibrio sulfoxidireducens]|uniref:tRNA1(Val) (adenine(37)-N6)-methyltransferase n=1 Tax=Desulfolutivibrio sulfoxidireducens TaxID=2773299 RepID=UPI00159E732E|nr:methyltransferase domain-containing protein [Desulfolutivibrio sulfoxidireducens]QLA16048.1 methyltransferase domain-containing protein [Desulfolutivibrio sulfoxidireducens]